MNHGGEERKRAVFNWHTVPTFAVMLLFWSLAAYIMTRSPRSLVSVAAAGAEVAAAAFLLGQGMQANAPTLAEWRPWARNLLWGATLAPALWYLLTVLLLREQRDERLRAYLHRVSYPSAVLIALLCLAITALIYVDDLLFQWSTPVVLSGEVLYSHFHLLEGTLNPAFLLLLLASTLGAIINLGLALRLERSESQRRRFAWLLLSAILFFAGANALGPASSLRRVGDWAVVPSHLALGAAMLVMVWNVASYSLLIKGQIIRRDALYFLTSMTVICGAYATACLVLAGAVYSFHLLEVVIGVLVLVVLSHALVDPARRVLDSLFFNNEVQQLRSDLDEVSLGAGLAADFDGVLQQAQHDLNEASISHVARLTEDALRRLNNPAALARCELLSRLVGTIGATASARGMPGTDVVTPLQRAQLLREVLLMALERLRPIADSAHPATPGAIQYEILRGEYLLGIPNKQLMTRLSVSESTFHRNRREAIAILARELADQERLLDARVRVAGLA
jgi:hypothetical protein